ncbi:pectate lyase [Gilvimarinus sp. SDUM040013]|uniref:Pectate lyase n=1 Tax=Gilvimarinus gilvus TaxID=3058038 RepID=A0ABU4RVG9_9GAMM|nr:pectate lyase [Gilvimarinus sp. SDUM040013]MDO3387704.1 pectate lyase [Gilvimarinus sp. SDUM040013]MDX6848855.1 pectate lyase [Gilvimarinus sp. SDUM040013]
MNNQPLISLSLSILLAALMGVVGCTAHEPVYREIPTANFASVVDFWHQQSGLSGAQKSQYPPADILPVAENLLLMQRNNGGWPAYHNPFRRLSDTERLQYLKDQNAKDSSFRNYNIFPQVFYLSHVYLQTGDVRYRNAARRAIRLIMASQVYNGGWTLQASDQPQEGEAVLIDTATTLDAQVFLRKVAAGEIPYGYIPFDMRRQAAEAVRKGDQLLLRMQQAYDSRLAIWASAYRLSTSLADAADGEAIAALNVPLSVRVVRYLMAIKRPPAEIVRSVEGAAEWFRGNTLQRWLARQSEASTRSVTSLKSRERLPDKALWAQRYDIVSSTPLHSSATGSARTVWFGRPVDTGAWARPLLQAELKQWRQNVVARPVSKVPEAP